MRAIHYKKLVGAFRIWVYALLVFVTVFSPILPSLDPLIFLGALTTQASTLTWDSGGKDGRWDTPENWSEDRIPSEGDIATFPETGDIIEIVGDVTVAGIQIPAGFTGTIHVSSDSLLTIGSEGFHQSGGRFLGGDGAMDVNGSLVLSGGEFNAPTGGLLLSDNLFVTGDTFRHNAGTVVLDGFEQIISGTIVFNNLVKIAQIGQTLELPSGKTLTIEGSLKLKGGVAGPAALLEENYLKLRASEEGTPAIIDPRGAIDVEYLDIKDVLNISVKTIKCLEECRDSGNTAAITFPEATKDDPIPTATPIIRGIVDRVKSGILGDSKRTTVQIEEKSTTDFKADEPIEFVIHINDSHRKVELEPVTINEEMKPVDTPEPLAVHQNESSWVQKFLGISVAAAEETSPSPEVSPETTPTITPTVDPSPLLSPSLEPSVEPEPSATPVIDFSPSPLPGASINPTPSAVPSVFVSPSPTPAPDISPSPLPTSSPVTSVAPVVEGVTATLTDPGGAEMPVEPEFLEQDGKLIMRLLEPETDFMPGKYRLIVTVSRDNQTFSVEQDFTWGVLAINPDKDIYAPGEMADIHIGVLNDAGHIVCDPTLTLTVTNPGGGKSTLSTVDGSIERTSTCGKMEAGIIAPDFQASLPLHETGEYLLQLTASTAQGMRSQTETVHVVSDPLLIIKRLSATRLWPFAPVSMTVEITSSKDFSGTIVEHVPASFVIDNVSSGGVAKTSGNTQEIRWESIEIPAGGHTALTYQYDAPDVSPEFYLLGPLSIGDEDTEQRSWQIASDAAFDDAATGNWNDCNTWGTCPGAVEGTDYPSVADTVTINSHTVTLAAAQSVNDITLATGGTLSGSSQLLKVAGSWTNTGGAFTEGTSTVMFTSASDETITSNGDNFNNVIINDGLVGYWKFDEGEEDTCSGGEDICDSSGYGYHGTISNAAEDFWVGGATTTNFTNAHSLDFDGSDDYVSMGDVLDMGSDDWTASVWFKTTDTDFSLISKSQFAAGDGRWYLVYSAGALQAGWDGPTVAGVASWTTASVRDDAWHLATATWDRDGNLTLYVDGFIQGTLSIAADSTYGAVTSNILTFGRYNDVAGTGVHATDLKFDGLMDDVRIYNRVLTGQEVNTLAVGNQPATENTAASEFTLEDTLDVNGNLVLNSGELDTKSGENNNITLAGEWHNNGGKFTPRTNTVTLDGTTELQELQSGGQNFYNLTVSGTGGWTLHDRLEVDNTAAQSAGTLGTSVNSYNIHAGDWDQTAGTFNVNSSTLTLKSSSSQTINTDDSLYDLQVEDPTEASLLGYWKFDEGQGTSAGDSSGNGNTGTLTNTPRWIESINSTTTYDNPYSLDFDASDDYVTMGDVATLDVNDTADLVISGWFNRDTFTTDDTLVAKRNGQAAGDTGYIVYIDDSEDDIRFEISDDTDEYQLDSATTFTATGWNHFVIVWDQDSAANSEIYINGVDDNATDTGTIANIGTAVNAVDFRFGGESDGGELFEGKLDDVRVYSAVLSAASITALAAGKYADGDNSTATFTLNKTLDVTHSAFLQSGILDASASNCSSATCAISVAQNWNNYGGTSSFTARTGTVTLDGVNQTINGSTTFYNLSKTESVNNAADETVTMQASETTTVSHTLTLDGRDPSDEIALISSSSGTKHTINVSGGGQTVDHVDVKDSQASSNDITCQACTNSGGNDNAEASPHWVFQAGGSITVAGTVYSDEGSTPLTGGKTVSVAINGGVEASGETNTTTGVYSITSPPTTAGDVMTIYLENETEDAVTVTVNDGTNMSGVDLYQNKLITRHDNAGSLTNANLSTAQFGTGGSTVFSDLFTTASDTALLSHAPNTGTSWTKLLSFGNTTVNNLTVKAADYLQRGGGSGAVNTGSLYTANATYPSANYEVSVQQVQAQPDDDYSSIAARIQDANNFYVFWWSEGGGALGKVVSGASSSLGSTAVSIADGSIVKLRVEGTSIQVYDDSTLLIDATDSSITAAGKAGVGMGALKSNLLPSADLTLQRVDSFSVKTIGEDDITAIYSVTNGELTMVSGKELLVWGGDTFAPGGKINVDDIDINGTLTLSSNTAKVSGSWDATGGSFTSSGNVVFTSPSDETIISDGDAFNNVYINDGLIGYWKMDAGTGTTVVDSSGYGFNGTLTNSAGGWTSSAPSVNFTDPYALDFDGTDDYVDIADTDTLDVGPTADFTISGWFNRDTFTTMDTILAKKENTATTPGYLLYIHDTLDVLGFKVADGLTAYSVTSTSTFTSTGWNHFVVVWDQDSSANTKMYINGVAEGTPSGTIGNVGDLSNSLSLRFGTESDDGNPFDGKLDDIRIYNRVLTAQEVNSLAVGNQPATENTAASEFTLEDTLDVNGNLVLNSGELDTKSGEDNSITLAGEWHNNGGKFTPRSGTVTLDGSSSSQEIQSGGQNFNNLTVSGSGGWTMHDRLEVDGAFAQSAGTFSTSSSNYNIQSGDWDQTAGTFNPNSSTVTLKSSSNQTINTDDPFYDLQVEDPTPANLLGYWKFDEGQGTSAFDSSGNASTGTLTNTPLWTETVNSTTTYDNPYSLDFDGTDDYVTAGDIAAVDTVTALTVCAWVYHDTATTDDSIVSKTASATLATDGFMLFRDDVGSASARTDTYKWGVGDSADGDSVYIEGATNAGTASAWRNVCGTYTASSATGLRLYINGAEDANSPASTSSIAAINGGTAAVQVGMISTSSIPFDGKIDDVRIYSSALTSTQIAALAAGKYADGNTSVATFTLNTALDVNHDLYLQSGILDVSASNCSSASCAITDARNWNNYGGTSSLTARTGTVTLDGTDQSVNGSTTFYNLTKNESSNNATDETVTMQINQTTTVSSRFTLEGRDSDDRINIVSSSAGTKHTIDVTAGQQVTHWVDVKDSQSSTSNIACQQCVNSGGNDDADAAPHWLFGEGSGRNRLVRALATD